MPPPTAPVAAASLTFKMQLRQQESASSASGGGGAAPEPEPPAVTVATLGTVDAPPGAWTKLEAAHTALAAKEKKKREVKEKEEYARKKGSVLGFIDLEEEDGVPIAQQLKQALRICR